MTSFTPEAHPGDAAMPQQPIEQVPVVDNIAAVEAMADNAPALRSGAFVEDAKAEISSTSPAPELSQWQELGRRTVAICLGVGISLSGAIIAPGHTAANDRPLSPAAAYPGHQLPHDQDMAPPPSEEAVTMVDRLLASPENPDIKHFEADVNAAYEKNPDSNYSKLVDQQWFKVRQRVAERYGLTVFDASETVDKLTRAATDNTSTPVERILIANKFLDNYGLRIEVDPTAEYDPGANVETATPAALDSYSARYFLINTVKAVAALPKEYIEASSVQRLLLASQKPNTKMKAGAYIYPSLGGPIGSGIVFNVSAMGNSSYDTEVIYHELGHRWDYMVSGGAMETDETFDAAAENVPYGKVGPEPGENEADNRPLMARELGWITIAEYDARWRIVANEFNPHIGKSDCEVMGDAADAKASAYGEKTVLESEYAGGSNVVEHKAETLKYLPLVSKYPKLLAANLPHIAAQFKVELSRLYTYFPRIARYFIGLASRPDPKVNPLESDPHFFRHQCDAAKDGALVPGGK